MPPIERRALRSDFSNQAYLAIGRVDGLMLNIERLERHLSEGNLASAGMLRETLRKSGISKRDIRILAAIGLEKLFRKLNIEDPEYKAATLDLTPEDLNKMSGMANR